MSNKEKALDIAQRHYGVNSYLMDSWVDNEWHILHPPEVWQVNVIFMDDKWYIEIPELEGEIVIGSFLKEVSA